MRKATKINTRPINRTCEALARISGVYMQTVVESEAAKVIEACIRFTPAASAEKIFANAGTGKAFKVDIGRGKKTYWMDNRYSDSVWQRLTQARKASLRRKLKARGLSKKSWALLAARAGIQVVAPGYVMNAVPTTGRVYPENAGARIVRRHQKYAIIFTNKQPTVNNRYVGGQRILARALAGRQRYFDRNMRAGVFSEIQKIARAYPGLKLR